MKRFNTFTLVAIASPSETKKAAAPSPKLASIPDLGAASRASLAITSAHFADPAFTASTAARSAEVPARVEPVWSAVWTARPRSRTRATNAAACFSWKGSDLN